MGFLQLTLVSLALNQSTALFGNRKKQDDDDFPAYNNIDTLKAASVSGFDATAVLREIRTNPDVQKKMRDMMKDPEALAELSQLMQDPIFKAQVEAFTANPD